VEEAEEEVTVTRQRKEGTCYGAALGARPPRGPVLAAGNSLYMVRAVTVHALSLSLSIYIYIYTHTRTHTHNAPRPGPPPGAHPRPVNTQ
jgi:hypothetical protein